jgi:hypothetical protein
VNQITHIKAFKERFVCRLNDSLLIYLVLFAVSIFIFFIFFQHRRHPHSQAAELSKTGYNITPRTTQCNYFANFMQTIHLSCAHCTNSLSIITIANRSGYIMYSYSVEGSKQLAYSLSPHLPASSILLISSIILWELCTVVSLSTSSNNTVCNPI